MLSFFILLYDIRRLVQASMESTNPKVSIKLADIASTGGHAKFLIQEGVVKVNGEVETRRGKKIRPGDLIEVEGNSIMVV